MWLQRHLAESQDVVLVISVLISVWLKHNNPRFLFFDSILRFKVSNLAQTLNCKNKERRDFKVWM